MRTDLRSPKLTKAIRHAIDEDFREKKKDRTDVEDAPKTGPRGRPESDRTCAQCGLPGDNEIFFSDGPMVRLHRECETPYRRVLDEGQAQRSSLRSPLTILEPRPAGRRATSNASHQGEADIEERPMGMDICGRKPAGERGEYFRNNVWWWGPLANYCNMIAPDICAPCEGWHYNDGDGLDAAGAVALAEALQKEIDAGRTESYARRYESAQERMPDEPCDICSGTGVRKPPPEPKPDADPNDPFPDLVEEFDPRKHSGAGDLKEGGIKCSGCKGEGYVRPWASHCPFSTENVTDFVAFLRESGGFVIW